MVMPKRMSEDARRAVLNAATKEAAAAGEDRIGTEHLLLGLLLQPGSLACRVLSTDHAKAEAAVAALDRAALTAIGIEVGERRVPVVPSSRHRSRFTSGARSLLVAGIENTKAEKQRTVDERHLLAAILDLMHPDPAADLIDALGVDREVARAKLRAA
jgi:ATP-dependent Clp protease ATP-binding subunit ClpA